MLRTTNIPARLSRDILISTMGLNVATFALFNLSYPLCRGGVHPSRISPHAQCLLFRTGRVNPAPTTHRNDSAIDFYLSYRLFVGTGHCPVRKIFVLVHFFREGPCPYKGFTRNSHLALQYYNSSSFFTLYTGIFRFNTFSYILREFVTPCG